MRLALSIIRLPVDADPVAGRMTIRSQSKRPPNANRASRPLLKILAKLATVGL